MIVDLIGAGAVGLSVAAALYGKCELRIIAGGNRKERYSNGLVYNGRKIAFTLEDPQSPKDKADLLIVAVKNFQLDDALDDIGPFVGDNTVILPLLNGIDSERILSAAFGADKVLYGFITDLSSNHSGIETVCFSNGGLIVFGEKDNVLSPRLERICALFEDAGQRYLVPKDILHEKWWKFCLNVCFNTLTAILDADYSQINGNRDFIRAVRLMAREVQTVASAEGVVLGQDDIEEMIRRLSSFNDHGKTSMLQDVEAGRNTENMYFCGTVSRLAHKHSLASPYCDFASLLLEARRDVVSKS